MCCCKIQAHARRHRHAHLLSIQIMLGQTKGKTISKLKALMKIKSKGALGECVKNLNQLRENLIKEMLEQSCNHRWKRNNVMGMGNALQAVY